MHQILLHKKKIKNVKDNTYVLTDNNTNQNWSNNTCPCKQNKTISNADDAQWITNRHVYSFGINHEQSGAGIWKKNNCQEQF